MFTQSHVNSYCWTHALYRYPDDLNHSIVPYQLNSLGAAIDVNEKDSSFKELGSMTYFRSVTLIFVMQAFLFKVCFRSLCLIVYSFLKSNYHRL